LTGGETFTELISIGIDLQVEQYADFAVTTFAPITHLITQRLRLRYYINEHKKSPTDDRNVKINRLRLRAQSQLRTFNSTLQTLLPLLSLPSDSVDITEDDLPAETATVHLPSVIISGLQLPQNVAARTSTHFARLINIELRLREAQADDALQSVRHYLGLKGFLFKDRKDTSTGQTTGTRATKAIASAQKNVDRYAEIYRLARQQLLHLGVSNNHARFKELTRDDLRPLIVPHFRSKAQQARLQHGPQHNQPDVELDKAPSWIWSIPGAIHLDADGNLLSSWHSEGVFFDSIYGPLCTQFAHSFPCPMATSSSQASARC
jgi:hypothetical protein